MKIFLAAVAIIAVIIVAVAVIFVAVGSERSWALIAGSPDRGRLEFASLERSPTANDALACTQGLRDDCDITIPAFDIAPPELAERIARHIEIADPLARRVDDQSAPDHLRYVTYSPTMRFPDLVNIEIVQMQDGRTGVLAYARAQLGEIDFDANSERLKRYFDGL
ncbi:MAG: DUF1499 domain-containing protein [Hyphomicrobiales bacterium]|nr:DUF1499 domain-containing protein [Hyphomicrobiales bacterium]MCP4999905.1 DUF1499 domain-containing protein [Hyphomicrobiales bacterium]